MPICVLQNGMVRKYECEEQTHSHGVNSADQSLIILHNMIPGDRELMSVT